MKIRISIMLSVILSLTACKKKDTTTQEPENNPSPIAKTFQYLTKGGPGADFNGVNWVIEGDTMNLGKCFPAYTQGTYIKSFNFEIGKEYNFKILSNVTSGSVVKNEGVIKFIDGNSNSSANGGGTSSVVFTEGAAWTYDIYYGQCGSITNQIQVDVP